MKKPKKKSAPPPAVLLPEACRAYLRQWMALSDTYCPDEIIVETVMSTLLAFLISFRNHTPEEATKLICANFNKASLGDREIRKFLEH
jgi:hypothetical protein